MAMLTRMTIGQLTRYSNSGMYRKFMPYQPVSRVSGVKMVVITVKRVMMWFCLTSMRVWIRSRSCTV